MKHLKKFLLAIMLMATTLLTAQVTNQATLDSLKLKPQSETREINHYDIQRMFDTLDVRSIFATPNYSMEGDSLLYWVMQVKLGNVGGTEDTTDELQGIADVLAVNDTLGTAKIYSTNSFTLESAFQTLIRGAFGVQLTAYNGNIILASPNGDITNFNRAVFNQGFVLPDGKVVLDSNDLGGGGITYYAGNNIVISGDTINSVGSGSTGNADSLGGISSVNYPVRSELSDSTAAIRGDIIYETVSPGYGTTVNQVGNDYEVEVDTLTMSTIEHVKNSKNYLNIKDFGAVGDGVTDDTEAIQLAIGSAEITNKWVYGPNGKYLITESITLPSNIKIFGDGKNSIIRASSDFIGAANGRPVMRNESRDSTVIDSNITLLNFTIDGNMANQSETGDVKCLELIFAKDVKLEGMNFINAYATARLDPGSSGQARGIGVWTEASEDILITKCTGGNCMYEVIGIRSGSKNIIVTECMFWQPSPKPAAFTGINAIQAGLTGGYETSVSGSNETPKGILVSNNITINASIDIHHAEQMRVSANYIIPPDSTFGVRVMGYEFDSYDDRIVEGNLINCSSGNIKRGIYIGDNTVATVVQNNKIVNASSSGIEVGNGADQTMVVGNTISTKQKTIGFYGIFCEDRNAIIKNNIIENCYDGIYVDLENPSTLSQGFLNISGNTISNTGRHGIRFNAAPSNVELYKTVANNTIQNISFQGISCSGGKYSLVTGNTVDSASSPTQGMGIALNNEEISIVTNNYVNNIAFRDYAVLNTLGDSVTAHFFNNLSTNGVTEFYNATTGSLVLTDADYLNDPIVSGNYDTTTNTLTLTTQNGNDVDIFVPTGTGGGVASWGSIGGTLADQTDLQLALDAKADDSDVLHTTGAESATGLKTFQSGVDIEVQAGNASAIYAARVENLSSENISQNGLLVTTQTGSPARVIAGAVEAFYINPAGAIHLGAVNSSSTHKLNVTGSIAATGGNSANWNAAYTHISNTSNPHSVTAAQVGSYTYAQVDSIKQFVVDSMGVELGLKASIAYVDSNLIRQNYSYETTDRDVELTDAGKLLINDTTTDVTFTLKDLAWDYNRVKVDFEPHNIGDIIIIPDTGVSIYYRNDLGNIVTIDPTGFSVIQGCSIRPISSGEYMLTGSFKVL